MEDRISEKVYLDEVCEDLIKDAATQYKIIALLFIIYSVISSAVTGIRTFRVWKLGKLFTKESLTFELLIIVSLIALILSAIQISIFFRAVNMQKNAIALGDQRLLQKSFASYRKGNLYTIVIALIWVISDIDALRELTMK